MHTHNFEKSTARLPCADSNLLLNSQIKKPDCFFILLIRPDSIPKTQTNRIFSHKVYTTLYTTYPHMHGFEINKHNQ